MFTKQKAIVVVLIAVAMVLWCGTSAAQNNLPIAGAPTPQDGNPGLLTATPAPKVSEGSSSSEPTNLGTLQVQGTNAAAPPDSTVSAQGMSSGTKTTLNGTSGQSDPQLVIGSGDLIEISVFGAPEYDKQVRVSDTGEVTLPFVNVIKVGGMTIEAAESAIQKKLSDGGYFKDPQVSVVEKEYATQGISILGEVQKPGIYPLLGPRTLLEAISAAGGTTPRAGRTITITHRSNPKDSQVISFASDNPHSVEENVRVYPGDTISVAKAGVVYVVGDVKLPTGVIMDKAHFTVLQAIAMAQGTNPTASLDKTMIIRKTATGQQEIPIPLKKILSAKSPDLPLQAEDIIFVPSSAAKSAGRRSLEAIVQTATGLAVYRR